MASGGSNSWVLTLVLVGIVGGFGTWNYKRNAEADETVPRPFRTYSDGDLASLTAAYEQELKGFVGRYEVATGSKVNVAGNRPLGEQVREFERIQRMSRNVRDLKVRITEREASLSAIQQERALRADESQVLVHFLKQAFVYRG